MQVERLARCKGQGCRLVIDIHFWAWVGTVNDKLFRGGLVDDAGLILSVEEGAQDQSGFGLQVCGELNLDF